MFPDGTIALALSLWHYRFGIIALALSLWSALWRHTFQSTVIPILQGTRHYNITSYSITYYLRATYASPHVESSASYRLKDRLRYRATGIGGPGSRSRARVSSSFFSLGGHSSTGSEIPWAGAEPEPPAALSAMAIEGSSSRKQFLPTSLVFHLLSSFSCFVILEMCFDLRYYNLVCLFCWVYNNLFRMNELMNLRFRPRWRGTEIWMHSGEPWSGYLARPPYLQKCRRGRGPEPSRSVQQLSRPRRWQGRRSR